MEQKALDEIKARTEEAQREGFGLQQFDDLDYLIAEVERLTAKLQTLTGVEAQEHQQIATLKKVLGLMAKYIVEQGNVDINLCDDIPNELHLKYQPKNDGNYPNEPCIQCVQEYFRQQAEQITHGEAEK